MAVLWILVALATLVSIAAIYVSNTAVATRIREDRLGADALTSGALEAVVAILSAPVAGRRAQSGAISVRIGRQDVAVSYSPETVRIDLNAASKAILSGLFVGLGADPAEAEGYADRITAWRRRVADPDGAAFDEASLYRSAGKPYGPRGAPFNSTAELMLVAGIPPVLARQALPHVTVYSGRPSPDVPVSASDDGAPPPVGGAGDEGERGARTLAATGSAIRVELRFRLETGRTAMAECVILILPDGDEPYYVLSWRDDLDGPI